MSRIGLKPIAIPAGLGSSVVAHAASETREPVKQGLWGIFEVFFDTFIICTLTALLFLTTNIKSGAIESFTASSSGTCQPAISKRSDMAAISAKMPGP